MARNGKIKHEIKYGIWESWNILKHKDAFQNSFSVWNMSQEKCRAHLGMAKCFGKSILLTVKC